MHHLSVDTSTRKHTKVVCVQKFCKCCYKMSKAILFHFNSSLSCCVSFFRHMLHIYTVREKRVFIKHFGDVSLIPCSPTVPSYYKNWIELRIEREWEKMKKETHLVSIWSLWNENASFIKFGLISSSIDFKCGS